MWEGQRNVRPGYVKKLAADMSAGKFRLSSDAIMLVKGMLVNGQHRMQAIIESGEPQSVLFLETNDEEVYKVLDCGMRRLVSDALTNVPYRSFLPSIARWVRIYDDRLTACGDSGGANRQAFRG